MNQPTVDTTCQVVRLVLGNDDTDAAFDWSARDGTCMANGHYRAVLRDVARRASAAELLVATEDGRVLGTVTLVADRGAVGEIAGPDEAEFRMLAVDPAAQGRGVGAALLRRVVDETRARGKARIVCSSLPEMRAAHRVYERAGFRRAPARDWSPVDDVRLLAFVYSAEA